MKRLFLVGILLLLLAAPVWAQATITFGWDPHPQSSDLVGFRLYSSKQSGVYGTTPIGIFSGGSVVQGTVNAPTSPGRWYFVLRAFITDGTNAIESDNSNEVSMVVKPKAPTGFKQVVSAPIAAISKLGDWLTPDKGLRIVR